MGCLSCVGTMPVGELTGPSGAVSRDGKLAGCRAWAWLGARARPLGSVAICQPGHVAERERR